MKKIFLSSGILLMLFFGSGCVYTDIQMPMDKNFNDTELGNKEGLSSTHTVLYLVAWGDSGSKAAAKAGNIKVI